MVNLKQITNKENRPLYSVPTTMTTNTCGCDIKEGDCCSSPEQICTGTLCEPVTIDSVEAMAEGKKEAYVPINEFVTLKGDKDGQNCEFQYNFDTDDGTNEATDYLLYKYKKEGVYYPIFTVSCKKCPPPSKSDQVMVVVGCSEGYANDNDMCCVDSGKLVPNNPIEDLDECPNRVKNTNWAIKHEDTGGYDEVMIMMDVAIFSIIRLLDIIQHFQMMSAPEHVIIMTGVTRHVGLVIKVTEKMQDWHAMKSFEILPALIV